ncbi:methyltransferase [Mycobacterium decipiens]|uniref:Methyltransferase n=1 Tax=Mycobacterium decipiens TaxID=1430326 RepID=A0A1X2LZ28_9MYCO|nr:methyltransferase [Mycobacterium decipiens]OSC42537.1 methyltransferase [Mycobacterium decipiens]
MDRLSPDRIMAIGAGYGPSKVLLTAVGLGLFTELGKEAMTAEAIAERLGLVTRPATDFLDALVSLDLLARDGDGPGSRYRNTPETAHFLDEASPAYQGGLLKIWDERNYRFWGDLTEALKTGKAQSEVKRTGRPFFEALYADPRRLEVFMAAMDSASRRNIELLAERFPFQRYRRLCDVGGADGLLSRIVAAAHPHLQCVSFDLPAVTEIARRKLTADGLGERVQAVAGDFLADPLPAADVITMGQILHDWNLDRKQQLVEKAYQALPEDGAFIVIETLIDDARRENTEGLMMSLNMLVEFGDAFDYSGADFREWCGAAGFRSFEVIPLAAGSSAAVAYR